MEGETQAQANSFIKEVSREQSCSQKEIFSKVEVVELEPVLDSTLVITEAVKPAEPIKIINAVESDTLDIAGEPTLNLSEHANCKTIKSPMIDGGENLSTTCDIFKNISENIREKEKLEPSGQPKSEVLNAPDFPARTDLESYELKDVEILRDALETSKKTTEYPASEDVNSTVELELLETGCTNKPEQALNTTKQYSFTKHSDQMKTESYELKDVDIVSDALDTNRKTTKYPASEDTNSTVELELLETGCTCTNEPEQGLNTTYEYSFTKHNDKMETNINEVSTTTLEDPEEDISSESQNIGSETFIEHESFNLESENSKNFNTKIVETTQNPLTDGDKPCNAVLEVANSVQTKTGEASSLQPDFSNITVEESDVDMQTSVITIEDTFEESPCKQPQGVEAPLNGTIITASPKSNLITHTTTNASEHTENIEEVLSNTIIIESPKKKIVNGTFTEHIDYNIVHVDVCASEGVTISDEDSFTIHKNEFLEDNTYETTEIDKPLDPGYNNKLNEIINVKANVDCGPRKTEVNMNNILIVIDDSLKESAMYYTDDVTDNDKTSPVISISSSEADQDEVSEMENVIINPINQLSDVANETFATCRQSLVTEEMLEFSEFTNPEDNNKDMPSLEPVEIVCLESTVSRIMEEDVVAYSTEALNSTEGYLVAALEALNINCDDKDDTFLSCQENLEQSNIEDSFLHERNKSFGDTEIGDHSRQDTSSEGNVDEEENIIKIDNNVDILDNNSQVSEEISKTVLHETSTEGHIEEAPTIEVYSQKSNIEVATTERDKNSSSETGTSEDNKSNLSTEISDISCTKSDSAHSPEVIRTVVINSEASANEVVEIVRSSESSVEQETIKSVENTTCEAKDNKINLSAEIDDLKVSPTKSNPSCSPQPISYIINIEANVEEVPKVHYLEYSTEQNTMESIKNIYSETVIAEDSKINVSATNEKVESPTTFDPSNSPQGSNSFILENPDNVEEAPSIVSSSPKSITEQDTIESSKHTSCETVILNGNKSDLSAEADDISPLKSFVSADVSVSSCDTPERSLLSYSTLMEASPSIFAQQVATYEKQSHLKLRINELEQTVAKLKLQLRRKEAVIMNLQVEKIKGNEKNSKTPLSADNIIKKLRKCEDELEEAKLKITELENKCENEKNLFEAKIKSQEQDLADYSVLKKEYTETLDRLKNYEQKNFDLMIQVEQAERDRKKALDSMEKYETVLLNFTTSYSNIKKCLEHVTLKYEEAKSVALGLKNNEDVYKKENDELQDKLKNFAEKYEIFKRQALAQIQEANEENFKLKQQIQAEKKVRKPAGKK